MPVDPRDKGAWPLHFRDCPHVCRAEQYQRDILGKKACSCKPGQTNPVAQSVLMALATYAVGSPAGHCDPSLKELCRATGWGKSAVTEALGILARDFFVKRRHRTGKGDSTLYKLLYQGHRVVHDADSPQSGMSAQRTLRQEDSALGGSEMSAEREGVSAERSEGVRLADREVVVTEGPMKNFEESRAREGNTLPLPGFEQQPPPLPQPPPAEPAPVLEFKTGLQKIKIAVGGGKR